MAEILDTSPEFINYSKKGFLEVPVVRDQMWRGIYEAAHPAVFEAFYAGAPGHEGRKVLVRDLSRVQQLVTKAAPVTAKLIEEVEPAVRGVLELPDSPAPRHVLMVGPYSTNVLVGRLDGQVTLFHCLEWFTAEETARVLIAHEDTHAWHEIATGEGPPSGDDLAATAFYEGVAIHASRAVVPDRPADDYFWFGHAGFEDWLPWCTENREVLLGKFAEALDDPKAPENWFGGGFVDDNWRVGYYVADQLVGQLGLSLPELVRMGLAAGGAAVRAAALAKG